ncbi:hypothetical protein PHMEG_00020358 [Phytophthora megakarya]|uniref:Uncharacterized protein n=1 Tax=Phytophthora megakarya TaxID=4795 RepID=A0A225VPL6_9STRA|nr:hypothetical protein PHMEG_00020358 [Phytophthora megakarya]
MHKKVLDEKKRRRVQDMAAHKGSVMNFDVGDFVLWSRIDQRLPDNKLLAQWFGLFKVTEARQRSFSIQHLVTGREYDTTDLLEFILRQGMMLGVEAIRDHRFNDTLSRWELLISWIGLQAIEDS